MFKLIDLNTWKRKPYFDLFFEQNPCNYSMTANIDITNLIKLKSEANVKLYSLLIYAVSKAVNTYEEYRTDFNEDGKLGIWDYVYPSYTIFHKESETFSNIWTPWDPSVKSFITNINTDLRIYQDNLDLDSKPNPPKNIFYISSIPWMSFTSFNLNIKANYNYLLPIFTFGKYFEQDNKILIPLSIQVHHAVCDGYHTSRLFKEIENIAQTLVLD